MNLIESNQLTMSSEQLCELLEIRHDNLRAKAFKMQSEGNLTFTENLGKGSGRPKAILYFDKRNSIVIAAKLNDQLLTAVVDRWMELESKQPALPGNYIEALESLIASEKEKAALAEQIEQQKPAVSFVADYVEATTGSKTFREVAKLLKENERELRAFLVENKIMYRKDSNKTWYAYSQHEDAGRFEVKTGVNRNGHSFSQTLFTAKGFTWLAGEIGKEKALALV